jgi:hypothetical protein
LGLLLLISIAGERPEKYEVDRSLTHGIKKIKLGEE